MKSLILFTFVMPISCLFAAATWVDFWTSLAPAITMVLFAIAGWLKLQSVAAKIDGVEVKVDKSTEKVDKVVVTAEGLKVAMNGLTKERVDSAASEATANATLAERERASTQKLQIDAAVNAATSTVTVSAGNVAPDVAGSAIEKNVVEVKKTVGVIDENVKDVKGEVLKDVGDVVRDAVKDVTEKPK